MSKPTTADAAKARAEALFTQGGTAAATRDRLDADPAKVSEAEKTAKLRALRLAKEQSDRIAAEVRKARRQR